MANSPETLPLKNRTWTNPGQDHNGPGSAPLAETGLSRYIVRVQHLTKQERLVICVVIGLLVTGGLVKAYRTAHHNASPVQTATP